MGCPSQFYGYRDNDSLLDSLTVIWCVISPDPIVSASWPPRDMLNKPQNEKCLGHREVTLSLGTMIASQTLSRYVHCDPTKCAYDRKSTAILTKTILTNTPSHTHTHKRGCIKEQVIGETLSCKQTS